MKTLAWLQGKPPPAYHEMALALNRIHTETATLLQMFATDCKLPMSSIPFLGYEIDITGTQEKAFTIDKANWALGREYTRLKDSLGRTKKKELAIIAEKRNAVLASIERYNETKAQHDVRVSAAFAAAFVAFKTTPDKVSPVVKGIMNGIKVVYFLFSKPFIINTSIQNEENEDLQKRSAVALAIFIQFCTRNKLTQPPDKIVKNLCTFLCQDVDKTPTFAYSHKILEAILSFQTSNTSRTSRTVGEATEDDRNDGQKYDEAQRARIARRGARQAFQQLSETYGEKLLNAIPSLWQSVVGGLLSACQLRK